MISEDKLITGPFFRETLGGFVEHKEFQVERHFIPPMKDKDVNLFCWNLRNVQADFMELSLLPGQNFSNQEKGAPQNLMLTKQKCLH